MADSRENKRPLETSSGAHEVSKKPRKVDFACRPPSTGNGDGYDTGRQAGSAANAPDLFQEFIDPASHKPVGSAEVSSQYRRDGARGQDDSEDANILLDNPIAKLQHDSWEFFRTGHKDQQQAGPSHQAEVSSQNNKESLSDHQRGEGQSDNLIVDQLLKEIAASGSLYGSSDLPLVLQEVYRFTDRPPATGNDDGYNKGGQSVFPSTSEEVFEAFIDPASHKPAEAAEASSPYGPSECNEGSSSDHPRGEGQQDDLINNQSRNEVIGWESPPGPYDLSLASQASPQAEVSSPYGSSEYNDGSLSGDQRGEGQSSDPMGDQSFKDVAASESPSGSDELPLVSQGGSHHEAGPSYHAEVEHLSHELQQGSLERKDATYLALVNIQIDIIIKLKKALYGIRYALKKPGDDNKCNQIGNLEKDAEQVVRYRKQDNPLPSDQHKAYAAMKRLRDEVPKLYSNRTKIQAFVNALKDPRYQPELSDEQIAQRREKQLNQQFYKINLEVIQKLRDSRVGSKLQSELRTACLEIMKKIITPLGKSIKRENSEKTRSLLQSLQSEWPNYPIPIRRWLKKAGISFDDD